MAGDFKTDITTIHNWIFFKSKHRKIMFSGDAFCLKIYIRLNNSNNLLVLSLVNLYKAFPLHYFRTNQ